jgi:hypothetical protein
MLSISATMMAHDRVVATDQLRTEVEKHGKQLLQQIRVSARRAMSGFPDEKEFEKLDPISREYHHRVSGLLTAALNSSSWNDEDMARFAVECSAVKHSTDLIAVALHNNGDTLARQNIGGGPQKTCPTNCSDGYDKCLKENFCEYSILCIRCVPCSLDYGGCMAKCLGFRGGLTDIRVGGIEASHI